MLRILLTGGGSGGHVYPLLAVAKSLLKIENCKLKIRYYGPQSPYDELLRQEGIGVRWVMGSKWRRYFSPLNLLDVFKFGLAFLQSLWYLAWWRPNAAFSKGGPGALPVLLACKLYGVPIAIHESDAVMGLTNKISSRWAIKVFNAWGPDGIGIPLRQELLEITKQTASDQNLHVLVGREFRFTGKKPLILVIGGSQGSQRINDFIFQNRERLLEKYQLLHQVGEDNFAEYQRRGGPISNYRIVSTLNTKEMARAYAAADLIISRAGASAIFEIAAFGKPSILIPLPEAAHNHQLLNAQAYAATGAALVLEELNVRKWDFLTLVGGVLGDREQYQKMASAAKAFAKPEAADIIARNILNV